MSPEDLEILSNQLADRDGRPVTPPPYAIKLLEDTCKNTQVDWKLRHAYLMNRRGRWGVTLSIDGFRMIGSRHPDYAGQEGPFWISSVDGEWSDIPPEGLPYAAKVGIKRRTAYGVDTTWGVAKYGDYAVTGPGGQMWAKFGSTMIAKCAEMLGWRKAFPGSFGGLYGTEEMDQAGEPMKLKVNPMAEDYDKELRAEESLVDSWIGKINAEENANELEKYRAEIKANKAFSQIQLLKMSEAWQGAMKNAKEKSRDMETAKRKG